MKDPHLEKLLETVASKEWHYFLDNEVKEYKEGLIDNSLYSCSSIESLFKAKGVLEVLNWLLTLEDSVKMRLEQEDFS